MIQVMRTKLYAHVMMRVYDIEDLLLTKFQALPGHFLQEAQFNVCLYKKCIVEASQA